MIIYYRPHPLSCIKAALLQRLYDGECIEGSKGENLFSDIDCVSPSISVDDYSLEDVRELYEGKFGSLPWLRGNQRRQLEKMLFYGLRFNSAKNGKTNLNCKPHNYAHNNLTLALQIVNQALMQGIGVVMGKLTPEAGEFYRRARQVFAESHRVKGFMRFCPLKGNPKVLVGRAEFQHNIEDILLGYFRQRYPGEKVIILNGDKVFYLEGAKVVQKKRNQVKLDFDEKEFDIFWNTFYDSQVIEERLNKKLARKHIPKKLWSWVPEGEKLR